MASDNTKRELSENTTTHEILLPKNPNLSQNEFPILISVNRKYKGQGNMLNDTTEVPLVNS